VIVSVTELPVPVMVKLIRCPPVVGKLATLIGWPLASQPDGIPRPMIRAPSERCTASESSSTLLALAIPQACGAEPLPLAGCTPVHGEPVLGKSELSHQENGPLWSFAIIHW
jgi:hypothetical protein